MYFIKLWRTTVGDNIYPVLRLILPYRDSRAYNIKDYTLVKAVCRSLNLPKDSLTEKRLLNWKQYAPRGTSLSKFCVEEIMKRRKEPQGSQRLTIDALNKCLDELSKEASAKKWGFNGLSKSPSFQNCLQNMSFSEQRYFFDIILKTRVIGGLEHKFLNCWHPDAQDYLGVVSDLKVLSETLWNPTMRLGKNELSINIGRAFAPHLAKRLHLSYERVCAKLKQDFIIEEKMDGERIQLHYIERGAKIRFLSRRGTDFTHLYGDSLEHGVISQHLKFKNDVQDCVLDGEMVSFDKEKNVVLPFGIVKSTAMEELMNSDTKVDTDGYRPLYMIFDLVYLNGVSLTRLPLHLRKSYLRSILSPVANIVEILSDVRASEPNAIKVSLERAIEMGSEGIILKQFSSPYEIGARNDSWIKIKPEYFEELGETMDLVVIGRDPGKKDSLMCGLILADETDGSSVNLASQDDPLRPKQRNPKVISFCNIANGVSDAEFKEIERKTRGLWNLTTACPPPSGLLEFGTKLPTEWIDPRSSLVLEVKARSVDTDELSSKKYKTGSTLRGAYCRALRFNKDWSTCATVQQYEQAKRAHNYHKGKRKSHQISPRKQRKLANVSELYPLLADDSRESIFESNIFQGLQFYILSDYIDSQKKRYEKDQIGTLVRKNSGHVLHNNFVRREEFSRLRIISGKNTVECRSLTEKGYDIIHPSWIFDCLNYGSLVKLEPRHCFRTSRKLLENSRQRVDRFGDSFCRPLSYTEFDELVNGQSVVSPHLSAPEELDGIPLFLFQNFKIYFARVGNDPDQEEYLEKTLRLFGGERSLTLDCCNLVVVRVSFKEQKKLFKLVEGLRKRIASTAYSSEVDHRIPHLVSSNWLEACINEQCLVPEEDFPPL